MGTALSELAKVALDPGSPDDERYDATGEAFEQLRSELTPGAMLEVQEEISSLLANQTLMKAATRLEAYTIPYESRRLRDNRGHQSILQINEFGVVTGSGGNSRYVEKPGGGGFGFLRQVVNSVDIIKAIILTRQRQIEGFCHPESDQSPFGFKFVHKDGSKVEDEEAGKVERLKAFVMNSGDEPVPWKRKQLQRDAMPAFVKKLVHDTLSADACPIEVQSTNGGKVSGLYNIPYDTIRLCTEEGYEGDDRIQAVQVIDDVPHVAFGYEDLIYEIRNPRSDLIVNGYGYAETEMLVRVLTAYMNAINYNAAGLDRNSTPRGMILVKGDYHPREMNAFRSQFDAMLRGASNRWRIPMMSVRNKDGGIEYLPIDQNYNEMFFARWVTFLVSVACAIYSIDPAEIHFGSFDARSTTALSSDDTEEKLAHSLDKGLRPLSGFVEGIYNDWIIPRVDDRYRIKFVGLRKEDEQKQHELLKLGSTIDEVRALTGQKPHADEKMGNAPANPALLQVYMASLQQQMMADQGQSQGEEGQYPEDENGNHDPYQEGDPGDDDHFHTLRMGGMQSGAEDDEEGDDQPLAKATVPYSFRVERA